jgi:MFS family permease
VRHFVWRELHPVVKMILLGSVLINISSGMIVPYFAIYIGKYTGLSLAEIGLVIGLSSLAGMAGGFIGGTLSDLLGRKKVMLVSLFLSAFIMLGLTFQVFTILLVFLTIIKGFTLSFYDPCAKALIGDLTDSKKRLRVFSLKYFCGNLGFAIGPILGTLLGLQTISRVPFYIGFTLFLVYGLFLSIMLSKYHVQTISEPVGKITFRTSFRAVWRDKVLLLFLIGGLLAMTVHGQFSVTLSQYFYQDFNSGLKFLGILWSVHSLTIITLSIPISRIMEKRTPLQSVITGSLFFTVGLLGFAFSFNLVTFLFSMIVFTIGEIFLIPAEYAVIDEITPNHIRGTYYGVVSFTTMGSFFGPWLSGILLTRSNSVVMFIGFIVIMLACMLFYFWGARLRGSNEKDSNSKLRVPS